MVEKMSLILMYLVLGCKAGVLLEEKEVIIVDPASQPNGLVRAEELVEVEEVVLVREGETALLGCNSPTPWFFCAWSWGSERACLLQEGGGGPEGAVPGGRRQVGSLIPHSYFVPVAIFSFCFTFQNF